MQDQCDLPVTVKHRIGIDHMESYQELVAFVAPIAAAGCEVFIVHARKAWLQGLSPKQNREIPPLNYAWVYQLKQDFPALTIVLNGGVQTLADCEKHLQHVDGIMLGREAYQNPWVLSQVDQRLFNSCNPCASREQVIAALLPYTERQLARGSKLNHVTRHILGLYQGMPNARKYRRHLSENAYQENAGIEVLQQACAMVQATTVALTP